VLRDHELEDEFIGPRLLVYTAALEMHPLDTGNRVGALKDQYGIGYCNITKCCTNVCPEDIHITDNAIIPLKERVADEFYDPLKKLFRMFRRSAEEYICRVPVAPPADGDCVASRKPGEVVRDTLVAHG